MFYAPGSIDDWCRSSARGSARIAMTLMMAHYGEFVNLKEMKGVMPNEDENGEKIDEEVCRQATYGYDAKVANLVALDNWYKERPILPSPKKGQGSQTSTSDPEASKEPEVEAAKDPEAEASEKAVHDSRS